MEVANEILREIRNTKIHQKTSSMGSGMSGRTLRPTSGPGRPTPSSSQPSMATTPSGQDLASQGLPPAERRSYQDQPYEQLPPRTQSLEAAKAAQYGQQQSLLQQQPPTSPTQQRPAAGPRTSSSQSAAAAAAAVMGKRPQSGGPGNYQRSSTDYTGAASARSSGGYAPTMDSHPEDSPRYDQPGRAQPQPSQTPTYDPSRYAGVSGYPQGPAQQQKVMVQPPTPQSPSPQPSYNPQTMAMAQGQKQAVERKEPAPSANDPGRGRRIGLDHFNFLAVLGKGNFGKVMLAETKQSKQLYAIKVLKKEFIIENDEVESTRSEKRVFLIANKERHPFLLNLHACFQTETRVYFVMEYISGGDLMLHIQRGQFGTKRAQ